MPAPIPETIPTSSSQSKSGPTQDGGVKSHRPDGWLSSLDPLVQAGMIDFGADIFGGVVSGIGEDRRTKEEREFVAEQNRLSRAESREQQILQLAQNLGFNEQQTLEARENSAVFDRVFADALAQVMAVGGLPASRTTGPLPGGTGVANASQVGSIADQIRGRIPPVQ